MGRKAWWLAPWLVISLVAFPGSAECQEEGEVGDSASVDTARSGIPAAPAEWEPRFIVPEEEGPDYRRDGRSFRNSLGFWGLSPLDGVGSPELGGLGGARVSFDLLATSHFGFRLGGLGLAMDTSVAALGTVGVIFPFTTRRVRLELFGEWVGGLNARQTQGYTDPIIGTNSLGEEVIIPVYTDTTLFSYGASVGATVKAIIGPGVSLMLGGGALQWLSEPDYDPAAPVLSPNPYLMMGLGWHFRSEPWFMQNHDPRPPQLVLFSPAPEEGEPVRLDSRRVRVRGLVSSWAPISHVYVGQRRATLSSVPVPADQVDTEQPLTGNTREFVAELDLPFRGSRNVRVMAYDTEGRSTQTTLSLAPPVDQSGPLVGYTIPGFRRDSLTGEVQVPSDGAKVWLQAVLNDNAGVREVTVNGKPVPIEFPGPVERSSLAPGSRPYRFEVEIEPNPGVSFAAIAARDSLGNEAVDTVRFIRPVTAVAAQAEEQPEAAARVEQLPAADRRDESTYGPRIMIYEPREWSGGGTRGVGVAARSSIFVRGRVQYANGIRSVLINGDRAALSLGQNGTAAEFRGYVPIEPNMREVEVYVEGADDAANSERYAVYPGRAETGSAGSGVLEEFRGERWAVVIGISDYMDPEIPDLEYADDDARAVYNFLLSDLAGMGGFEPDHVRLLLNEEATGRNIRSALRTFLKEPTPDDVIFVYIAGHGMPDPDRLEDLYLLAYDTELADLAASGVAMKAVNSAVDVALARNKVVFTDACHSAGVAAGTRAVSVNQINAAFLDALNSSSGGFVAFTASETAQLSHEGEQYCGGHGAFTCALLRGFYGEADEDGNRIITLGEVIEYTRDWVRRQTRNSQVPTYSNTTFDRYWPMALDLVDGDGPGQGSAATRQ